MTGTLPRRSRPAPARDPATTGRWAEDRTPARDHAAPEHPAEDRIARLAEDAARQTPGVHAPTATVRADGRAARVELDVAVDHGEHLPTVAEAVRRRVVARVEAHTGLTVPGVTVTVVDLLLPEGGRVAEEPAAGGRSGGHTRGASDDDREAT